MQAKGKLIKSILLPNQWTFKYQGRALDKVQLIKDDQCTAELNIKDNSLHYKGIS